MNPSNARQNTLRIVFVLVTIGLLLAVVLAKRVVPGGSSPNLSGHEHNYDDVRGEGFFGQTRCERRAYPTGVCEERATKSGRKRTAARRVAPNLACGCVARRSQIHFGICSLLAPCPRPNSAQRTSPQLCS